MKVRLSETIFLSLIILFLTETGYSQVDSAGTKLALSGYLETYYSLDVSDSPLHTKPGFIYSHNRSDEFNLNLGYLKASVSDPKFRANLAIGLGTYMNANYAAEPGVLKNIFEANVGVNLSKKHNIWLDMGIMPSHIGFESAVSKDCWTVTRSILADNSPYFETGAKITYISKNEKWLISGLLLNDWQRIQLLDGNTTPSFGHQITFKPNDKITLNSSSFVGSDLPDKSKRMRYFHNFFGQFQVSQNVGIIAGLDVGSQQNGGKHDIWYSPVMLVKVGMPNGYSLTARSEYYSDPNQVIISTNSENGFKGSSLSVNLDKSIKNNVLFRIEARNFYTNLPIFIREKGSEKSNFYLTTSLAISF